MSMRTSVVLNNYTKSYAQIIFVKCMPSFNNVDDAKNGNWFMQIGNAEAGSNTRFKFFTKTSVQTNANAKDGTFWRLSFKFPFKITQLINVYTSGRYGSLKAIVADNPKVQYNYQITPDYRDRTTYHDHYKIKLSPQSYTTTTSTGSGESSSSTTQTVYEGRINYMHISGYLWIDDPKHFVDGAKTIEFIHPARNSNARMIKQNNKYYVFKEVM